MRDFIWVFGQRVYYYTVQRSQFSTQNKTFLVLCSSAMNVNRRFQQK